MSPTLSVFTASADPARLLRDQVSVALASGLISGACEWMEASGALVGIKSLNLFWSEWRSRHDAALSSRLALEGVEVWIKLEAFST